MPFRLLVPEVFVSYGLSKIDVVNVSQGTEPGDDVGEFFLEVGAVGAVEGSGQLADLLDEP